MSGRASLLHLFIYPHWELHPSGQLLQSPSLKLQAAAACSGGVLWAAAADHALDSGQNGAVGIPAPSRRILHSRPCKVMLKGPADLRGMEWADGFSHT